MSFVPKPPKYTIPTREIGVVCYPEQKGIGMQFADPEGNHIFIAIPGALIPALAEALKQTSEKHPESLAWPPAPYAAR